MLLQQANQVSLGATRLGEDHSLSGRAKGDGLLKADLERRDQSFSLGVLRNRDRQIAEGFEVGNLGLDGFDVLLSEGIGFLAVFPFILELFEPFVVLGEFFVGRGLRLLVVAQAAFEFANEGIQRPGDSKSR